MAHIFTEADSAPGPTRLPQRAWINQPSTLGPLHAYHGKRVLAVLDTDGSAARIYFVSGDTVSMRAPINSLSAGWPDTSRP